MPEHLIPVAGPYIFIIIAGLLATFLYDACAAALRALGDTVTPLVILAVSVALNIAGDLLFVLVLKAGVRGAAAATVLAQILAFVICWLYMLRRYEMLRLVREDFPGCGYGDDEKHARIGAVNGLYELAGQYRLADTPDGDQ